MSVKSRLATVGNSNPVDINTAMAMSGGERYSLPPQLGLTLFLEQPEIDLRPYTDLNLTGQRFDRLTVIGKAVKISPTALASWVCRCACGKYCRQASKSLRNGTATMCPGCYWTAVAVKERGSGICVRCKGIAQVMPHCKKCNDLVKA